MTAVIKDYQMVAALHVLLSEVLVGVEYQQAFAAACAQLHLNHWSAARLQRAYLVLCGDDPIPDNHHHAAWG